MFLSDENTKAGQYHKRAIPGKVWKWRCSALNTITKISCVCVFVADDVSVGRLLLVGGFWGPGRRPASGCPTRIDPRRPRCTGPPVIPASRPWIQATFRIFHLRVRSLSDNPEHSNMPLFDEKPAQLILCWTRSCLLILDNAIMIVLSILFFMNTFTFIPLSFVSLTLNANISIEMHFPIE